MFAVNTHRFIMADKCNIVIMLHQAFSSLSIFIVAFVSPPLDHFIPFVVHSTDGVVIMREFVSDCTARGSVIQCSKTLFLIIFIIIIIIIDLLIFV